MTKEEVIVYGLAMFILGDLENVYEGTWRIIGWFKEDIMCCEAKVAVDKRIQVQPVSYECFVSKRFMVESKETSPELINCSEVLKKHAR